MSNTQTASTVTCYQIKAIQKFHSFSKIMKREWILITKFVNYRLMLLYLMIIKCFINNNLNYLSDVACAYTWYSGWKNKISGSDRNPIAQRPKISISVRRKFAEYHRTEIPVFFGGNICDANKNKLTNEQHVRCRTNTRNVKCNLFSPLLEHFRSSRLMIFRKNIGRVSPRNNGNSKGPNESRYRRFIFRIIF